MRLRQRGLHVNFQDSSSESDCAAHAYGQVAEFLRAHPCVELHRAAMQVGDTRTGVVLVAAAWVQMPAGECLCESAVNHRGEAVGSSSNGSDGSSSAEASRSEISPAGPLAWHFLGTHGAWRTDGNRDIKFRVGGKSWQLLNKDVDVISRGTPYQRSIMSVWYPIPMTNVCIWPGEHEPSVPWPGEIHESPVVAPRAGRLTIVNTASEVIRFALPAADGTGQAALRLYDYIAEPAPPVVGERARGIRG